MSRDQRHHARRGGPNSFRCRHCGLDVPTQAFGTAHRNHCPNCLWSRHLDDDSPGDRDADCGSLIGAVRLIPFRGYQNSSGLSVPGSSNVVPSVPRCSSWGDCQGGTRRLRL